MFSFADSSKYNIIYIVSFFILSHSYILPLLSIIHSVTIHYTPCDIFCMFRHECGVPVIIEGETGVGKTALIQMLSKLWNQSHLNEFRRKKDYILELINRNLGKLNIEDSIKEDYMVSGIHFNIGHGYI